MISQLYKIMIYVLNIRNTYVLTDTIHNFLRKPLVERVRNKEKYLGSIPKETVSLQKM